MCRTCTAQEEPSTACRFSGGSPSVSAERFSEGTEALSDIQRRALSIPAPPAQQLQTEPSPEKWIGYISIHVDYQNGLRRSFKIKPHARMSALLRICARTSGAEYVSVLFEGRRIGDSDTPASLGMEDGVSALHVMLMPAKVHCSLFSLTMRCPPALLTG